MNNGEKLLIMRNVRRLIQGRIKQPPNWRLYMYIFSCGSSTACDQLEKMDVDPESIKTGCDL